MGLAKTHGRLLPCRKEQNRSDVNDNTRRLPTLGPPSTSSVTAERQHTSADADGLPVGGLERFGRHGLKPMLRPPRSNSVTMLSGYQPAEWLSDGHRCAVL